jgi:hypothetical protein
VKPLLVIQVKAALEQQNGAPPSDEEVFTEMLSKAMVEKDAIRAALLVAKQAADEKAAAEAAAAAEQAGAADQETPAAEDAAAE